MDDGRGAAAHGMAPVDGQQMPGQPHPTHHEATTQGPSVIYTRELQDNQHRHRRHRDVFLEDVESEYPSSRHNKHFTTRESTRSLPTLVHTHPNILCLKDRDGNRIFLHQEESADEIDSMRRHEMERGSDLGQVRYLMRERSAPTAQNEPEVVEVLTLDEEGANGREQHYVKAGNAEVLRLLTRGRVDERYARGRRVNQTDAGKDIIMRRFMEDQRHHSIVSVDSAHNIPLPGQVLLQMSTQTDEERGTQTENESLNSPADTPPQHEHAKHIIKTPILEENESSLEQTTANSKNNRENHLAGTSEVAQSFQNLDEMYERGKAETEFNYGDTKASMLRRKLNVEKTDVEGHSPDEKKQTKVEKDQLAAASATKTVGAGTVREKSNKPHRSQSLPRNANDSKRRRSLTESQKLSRQKSSSINSGLDKASRVTFASPNPSLSDEEFAAATSHKKTGLVASGANSLRASNTSLNKSVASTPRHRKSREDSISDDEKTQSHKSTTALRRASSNVSLHKSNSTLRSRSNVRDGSVSDDEPTVMAQKVKSKKTTTHLRASATTVKSTKSSTRGSLKPQRDESDDEKVKKATNSLRITKASSSRKSVSPASKHRKPRREGSSFSDEEVDKHKSVKPRIDSRRNSTSVSPAVRTRKKRKDHDSEEEPDLHKSKTTKKPTDSNLKKSKTTTNGNNKKHRDDESHEVKHKISTKSRPSHTVQQAKSPHPKENTQTAEKNISKTVTSSKNDQPKDKGTSKKRNSHSSQSSSQRHDSDMDSDGELPTASHVVKPVLNKDIIKVKSPTYEALVTKLDDEEEEPEEDEEEDNVSVLVSPNYSQDMNASNTSLQSAQSNETNQSNKLSFHSDHTNEDETKMEHLNKEINSNLKNEFKNAEINFQRNIVERSNNSSNVISSDTNNIVEVDRSNFRTSPQQPSDGDSMGSIVVHSSGPVPPIVTVQSPPRNHEPDKQHLETAMQTDVSLVPLINCLTRSGMDDDLDSGIAMSQTITEGRSKRFNQLIEKKSIFTIAYDDMHTKQLRADSASPQY
jgi:hypothetical protein